MSDITLNFINKSNDQNNSEFVIFSKNTFGGSDNSSVAWKVIRNLGRDDSHPFVYSSDFFVSVEDNYGNYTPQLKANPGDLFAMVKDQTGDVIKHAGTGHYGNAFKVENHLEHGSIKAKIYKDGKLFNSSPSLAPDQKVTFELNPVICISAVSHIQEGDAIESAAVSSKPSEISLLGIKSADIVVTGGGPGSAAEPFKFELENVVKA
ncbi:hypothetical protein [Marinobacterium sedimentorum]|uniref:hypothetical protein n=1 Tax=Marinobacterium sedimentorum TaxID=2927804 RepID=UPI0020C60525|nr:hypothetical protein [Marinobacterium sedimentorum]MCP8688100.1 hypothetical protein [Marinobacterium sedimentorum]